jgi:hypothetical protein
VAVLMLLKNKRKPQKAPFAGPAISRWLRVPEQQCTCTSARKSRERNPNRRTSDRRSEAARRPGVSAAPAEGQDAKRISASVRCGP